MAKRERKHRQTFPGPNSADNQQMLQDIKESLVTHHKLTDQSSKRPPSSPTSADSLAQQQLGGGSSPGSAQRQSSRLTPTKQPPSHETQRKLATIRNSLKPFGPRSTNSDPGFHAPGRDKVNQKMLAEMISLGYNEVSRPSYGWPCVCKLRLACASPLRRRKGVGE